MDIDWSAIRRVEMSEWLIPDNDVFPYSVKIHGNADNPNPEAMKLAKNSSVVG